MKFKQLHLIGLIMQILSNFITGFRYKVKTFRKSSYLQACSKLGNMLHALGRHEKDPVWMWTRVKCFGIKKSILVHDKTFSK